jgi:hypothetical protein
MVFICVLVSFMVNLIDARTIRNRVILQPVTMPPAKDVLDAIEVLRGMNNSNARKVSADAPVDFIKPRWRAVAGLA